MTCFCLSVPRRSFTNDTFSADRQKKHLKDSKAAVTRFIAVTLPPSEVFYGKNFDESSAFHAQGHREWHPSKPRLFDPECRVGETAVQLVIFVAFFVSRNLISEPIILFLQRLYHNFFFSVPENGSFPPSWVLLIS